MAKYVVGITGASGSIYAARLLEELLRLKHEVYLVVTDCGKKVMEYELNDSLADILARYENQSGSIRLYDSSDFFAPIASGSFPVDGMVVLPCSMTTLAKISNGIGDNLLVRAVDVSIKEKRNLVIVPRETPLSTIHLRNMLKLSEMGVTILPAMPNFYHRPVTIEEIVDSIVGRILRSLGIENNLYFEWDGSR